MKHGPKAMRILPGPVFEYECLCGAIRDSITTAGEHVAANVLEEAIVNSWKSTGSSDHQESREVRSDQ